MSGTSLPPSDILGAAGRSFGNDLLGGGRMRDEPLEDDQR